MSPIWSCPEPGCDYSPAWVSALTAIGDDPRIALARAIARDRALHYTAAHGVEWQEPVCARCGEQVGWPATELCRACVKELRIRAYDAAHQAETPVAPEDLKLVREVERLSDAYAARIEAATAEHLARGGEL